MKSVAVKAHVLDFLGENGLIDKVRIILKGVQKRQDDKLTSANILSPEDAASVFQPMAPELYHYSLPTMMQYIRDINIDIHKWNLQYGRSYAGR